MTVDLHDYTATQLHDYTTTRFAQLHGYTTTLTARILQKKRTISRELNIPELVKAYKTTV